MFLELSEKTEWYDDFGVVLRRPSDAFLSLLSAVGGVIVNVCLGNYTSNAPRNHFRPLLVSTSPLAARVADSLPKVRVSSWGCVEAGRPFFNVQRCVLACCMRP